MNADKTKKKIPESKVAILKKNLKAYLKYLYISYSTAVGLNDNNLTLEDMTSIKVGSNVLDVIYKTIEPLIQDVYWCVIEHYVSTWDEYLMKSNEIKKYEVLFNDYRGNLDLRDNIFPESDQTLNFYNSVKWNTNFDKQVFNYIDVFLKNLIIGTLDDKMKSLQYKVVISYIKILNIICGCKKSGLFVSNY